MQEIWKHIPEYEGLYEVSNLGRIRSLLNTKTTFLKGRDDTNGYLKVALFKNLIRREMKIHRLAAMAFIPNPENKPQVNHINGIKSDNRIENLEWCSQSENSIHAYKKGLQVSRRGKDNNKTKLTEAQVLDIRGKFLHISSYKLAVIYDVYATTIQSIRRRRTWKHI